MNSPTPQKVSVPLLYTAFCKKRSKKEIQLIKRCLLNDVRTLYRWFILVDYILYDLIDVPYVLLFLIRYEALTQYERFWREKERPGKGTSM